MSKSIFTRGDFKTRTLAGEPVVLDYVTSDFAAEIANKKIQPLVDALEWIVKVNAMDYDYRKVAEEALKKVRGND